MPMDTVAEVSENKENTVMGKQVNSAVEICERSFVTFSDEGIFKRAFRKTKPKIVQKNICPITR